LGDVWAAIEDAPGARLPDATRIEIRQRSSNRSFDLTETYVKLLSPKTPGEAPEEKALAGLSRSEDIMKLVSHFTTAGDSSTPYNALVLGRMVYDLRKGRVPLSEIPSSLESTSPEDLPNVRGSVDLADFKNVRELVRWAHDFNPSRDNKMNLSSGSE